jgi:succinate dehydrogenase/fumarate reductase flavoprotein subunit
MTKHEHQMKVSRRAFIAAAGAGTAAAALTGVVPFTGSRAFAQGRWDQEADIVVVGSGGAAGAAMATAHHLGNKVIVLEKSPIWGGTTAKSGGASWVCNNVWMRAAGVEDPRDDALRYMARCSYPTLYNPNDARLGLGELEYSLIATYYDKGAEAFELLDQIGAQKMFWRGVQGNTDYYAELPEDKVPNGRTVAPKKPDGTSGNGAEMARQFKAYADDNGVPVMLGHRVTAVVRNDQGAVVGVEAQTADGKTVAIGARKGVIFGSGGFTHNPYLRLHYLRGPIFGGCAVPTNEGDLVNIAIAAGAALGNMNNAWWGEVVLEQALENTSVPTLIWQPVGDSMIEVNKFGERYVDEKMVYNERTQTHFYWHPRRGEYPQLLTFMIYDDRASKQFAGFYPYPAKDTTAPYVITGKDWGELAANIDQRLKDLAGRTGGFKLEASFAENLPKTVAR